MVSEAELEGFRRDRYFARSWALLTRDKGWVKPVLLMTVALLVPIVGLLGVMGYLYEWARLTAWGVNAAPKQRGVRVGECIASGWRVFLVLVAWGIVWGFVWGVLGWVPLLGGLFDVVCWVLSFFVTVAIMVAALRATIYQKLGAGFRVSTIWQMVKHDASGLLRPMGIMIVGDLLVGLVAFLVAFSALVSVLPDLMGYAFWLGDAAYMSSATQAYVALDIVGMLISRLGVMALVLFVFCGFFGVVIGMLGVTAVGLWMRQFNVAVWGRDEDPLPTPLTQDSSAAAGPAPVCPQEPPVAAAAEPVGPVVPQEPVRDAAPVVPMAPTAEEPPHEPIPMPPAAPEVVAAAEEAAAAERTSDGGESAPGEGAEGGAAPEEEPKA